MIYIDNKIKKVSSLLISSVSINLPWSCFSFHCLCLCSFFYFLVVNTGLPYCGNTLSLLESLNNLSSDRSRYRERFCSWVSTQYAMLNSPRPPSILGMYSLSVSLYEWYILSIVIIFRVFLSIVFSSSLVHFSIPALYLTKDTPHEFIALIVFLPFRFDDVNCLTLL